MTTQLAETTSSGTEDQPGRRRRRPGPPARLLRSSWAPWAAPFVVAWIAYYSGDLSPTQETSWASATATSTILMIYVAPACAACAAWEGFRTRRLHAAVGIPVRSPVRAMVGACWPAVLLGWMAELFTLWLFWPAPSSASDRPDLRIVGMTFLLVAAFVALGYLAGLVFPIVIAVPLALMGVFLIVAMPPSYSDPLWLRHLFGVTLDGCCDLDEQMNVDVLIAPTLVYGGLLGSVLIALAARRWWGPLVAVLPLVSAVAMATSLVSSLGVDVTEPRSLAQADCDDAVPQVCVWPEQEHLADDIRAWTADVVTRLDEAGVTEVRQLDPISFGMEAPDQEIVVANVVSWLTEDYWSCSSMSEAALLAQDRTTAWLWFTAGFDGVGLDEGTTGLAEAQAVWDELSPAEQQRWYQEHRAIATTCVEPGDDR